MLKVRSSRTGILVASALMFGAIGITAVYISNAATPTASFESETGSVTSPATTITSASASNGSAVKFGTSTGGSQTLNCAPAANATMTNTVSHLCGFPDTTNTGPAAGTVFKRVPQDITQADATTGSGWHFDNRGWIVVDTNGGVIKNVDTAYNINVQADNVTVMNNRLTLNGGEFGITLMHTTNSIVKNNLLAGANASTGRVNAGIKSVYGDDVNPQIIANNIIYTSTGIQFDSGLIEGNYIHDMGFLEGDHTNGTTAGGGDDNQLTIRNNTIFNQLGQTDAISLFQDFGNQTNTLIDNNLVAGGGYCMYGGGNTQLSTNIKVTNNHFSRIFYPNCGYYGPMAAWQSNGPGNVATGNIWDDTGQPVSF